MEINLTQEPVIIEKTWGPMLYVQATGPFLESAPSAWTKFWELAETVDKSHIAFVLSFSYIDLSKEGDPAYTYRAGFITKEDLTEIPRGLHVAMPEGGKYARFEVTGPYGQLPQVYGYIFDNAFALNLDIRDAFCAEVYLNLPYNTPEEELKTEIYVPIN